MRLARLVVACVAFFVARAPVETAVWTDGVVLVASAQARETASAEVPREACSPAPAPRTACTEPLSARTDLASGAPIVVTLRYLRNCSLLC
jgi:hypothetical protein